MAGRHPQARIVTQIAGRRAITHRETAGGGAFARPVGDDGSTTSEDGVPLFAAGVHGFVDQNWVLWPG